MIRNVSPLSSKLIILLIMFLISSCQTRGEPIIVLTDTPRPTSTTTSTATTTPTPPPTTVPPIDTRLSQTPSPEEQAVLNKIHRQLVIMGFEGDMSRQSLLNLDFIPDLKQGEDSRMQRRGVLLARVDGEYMVILNLSKIITLSFNHEGDDGYRAFYLDGLDNILLARALSTSLQIPLHWLELNTDTSNWPIGLNYFLEWSGTIVLQGIEPVYGSWGNPEDQMIGLTYCDFQGRRSAYISSGPPSSSGCSSVPVMAYHLDGRALSQGDLVMSLMSHAQHLSTDNGQPIMINHHFIDVPFEYYPINPWTIPSNLTSTATITIPTVQMVVVTDTHTPMPTISSQTP